MVSGDQDLATMCGLGGGAPLPPHGPVAAHATAAVAPAPAFWKPSPGSGLLATDSIKRHCPRRLPWPTGQNWRSEDRTATHGMHAGNGLSNMPSCDFPTALFKYSWDVCLGICTNLNHLEFIKHFPGSGVAIDEQCDSTAQDVSRGTRTMHNTSPHYPGLALEIG